ncbi:hypothetical protein ES705_14454 [subsurface metagenome]
MDWKLSIVIIFLAMIDVVLIAILIELRKKP